MLKRGLVLAVKLSVSIGLIWLLAANIDMADAVKRGGGIASWAVVAALGLLVLQALLLAWRWRVVLGILHAPIAMGEAVGLYFVGLLFSQALPSTVGGDAMRIYLLRRAGRPLRAVIHSVMLDRIIGFVGIFLIILASLPLLSRLIDDRAAFTGVLVLDGVGLAGVAVFLHLDRLPAGLRRWRVVSAFVQFVADGRRLMLTLPDAAYILALALSGHVLSVLAVFMLAAGLGIEVSFLACLALVPPVMVLATVPVSLAGWGLREGAMVAALGFVGVPVQEAVVVSVLYGLAMLTVSLPGLAVWLARRDGLGRTPDGAPSG